MREVWPHSVTEEVEKYEKVTLIGNYVIEVMPGRRIIRSSVFVYR